MITILLRWIFTIKAHTVCYKADFNVKYIVKLIKNTVVFKNGMIYTWLRFHMILFVLCGCRVVDAGSSVMTAPLRLLVKAGHSCTRVASPTTTKVCGSLRASGTSPCPLWILELPNNGTTQLLVQTKQDSHNNLNLQHQGFCLFSDLETWRRIEYFLQTAVEGWTFPDDFTIFQ